MSTPDVWRTNPRVPRASAADPAIPAGSVTADVREILTRAVRDLIDQACQHGTDLVVIAEAFQNVRSFVHALSWAGIGAEPFGVLDVPYARQVVCDACRIIAPLYRHRAADAATAEHPDDRRYAVIYADVADRADRVLIVLSAYPDQETAR